MSLSEIAETVVIPPFSVPLVFLVLGGGEQDDYAMLFSTINRDSNPIY